MLVIAYFIRSSLSIS